MPQHLPEAEDGFAAGYPRDSEPARRRSRISARWENLQQALVETAADHLAIDKLAGLRAPTERIEAYLTHAHDDLGIQDLPKIADALAEEEAESGAIAPPSPPSSGRRPHPQHDRLMEQVVPASHRDRWAKLQPLLAELRRRRVDAIGAVMALLWRCTDEQFETAAAGLRAGRPWSEIEQEITAAAVRARMAEAQ